MYRSRKDALPSFLRRGVNRVQIKRPHTRQQIHLVRSDEEAGPVLGEDLPEGEEGDDDGRGEVILEEDRGIGFTMDRL